MSGLLPLLFALAIIETSLSVNQAPLPWRSWALVFGISLPVWMAVCEGVARLLSRVRDRRWLERWDMAAHVLMLGWLSFICYGLGWTRRVEIFYTPALLPWLVMLIAHWWCMAISVRSLGTSPWSRHGMVMHQLRFGMMPMVVVLPLFDACNYLTLRSGLQPWFIDHVGLQVTMIIGSLALSLSVLVLLPSLLVRLWRAQPIGPGEMRDLLAQCCERMGVGVAGIRVWPTDGGRVYNAAVIGVLSRIRYVLFTDDLLKDFPRAQVVAVLGHELGHARHRHLLIYLVFAIATLLTSFLLAGPATALIGHLPGMHAVSPSVQKGIATILLLAVKWRLIFGYLSRACERQADLAGAELCGDDSSMQTALRSVAHLSGQSEDAPSWRHYTIAERVAFLDRVAQDPWLAERHHRVVGVIGFMLILIVLALAAILGSMTLSGVPIADA